METEIIIPRRILAKRGQTKKEISMINEYKKQIPKDILRNRKLLAHTESDVIPSIIGDIQDGYSPILLFCGRQQKGKSRGGVTIANLLSNFLYYEYFSKEYFFFKPLNLLRKIDDEGNKIFILDEAGASGSGLNKAEWWTSLSKLFDYIIQTQANLRNIYIFILPFASDLVSDLRKYIDYMFSAYKLSKTRGIAEYKVFKIYKKEDQLVKNLKDFKQVWIENLKIYKKYLPVNIWQPIEMELNKLKSETRKEKIKEMTFKKNWLGG